MAVTKGVDSSTVCWFAPQCELTLCCEGDEKRIGTLRQSHTIKITLTIHPTAVHRSILVRRVPANLCLRCVVSQRHPSQSGCCIGLHNGLHTEPCARRQLTTQATIPLILI